MARHKIVVGFALVFLVVVAGLAAARRTIIEGRFNRVLKRPPYDIPSSAAELQRGMFVADLHADSLLWGRNLLQRSTSGHVDIARLEQAHVSLQAFTVVTTAPWKISIDRNSSSSDMIGDFAIAQAWPPRTWSSPKQRALYQAARLRKFEADSAGRLIILRSRSDLHKLVAVPERGRVGAILGAEGAQSLEGNLDNLDDLFAAGFRMMAPTHFTDTEVAGSASGTQRTGLTDLGRRWVRRMEAKGMLIDLAHASPATLRDVTSLAAKPVVVSHTGVKGTCDNNRNLSDDELRAVARTGGVVGIGYWETAVCGRDARSVARAIQYAARVAGVEHVALGSDFDGATTMPFDVTGLPLITSALRESGLSQRDIRLIMGENVVRVLSQILPE